MVWYIPPLSPVADFVRAARYDDDNPDQVFAAIEALRVPAEYLEDLYRLLAIARYDERYVIPPAHAEDAGRLMAQHEQLFCVQPGGPDPFHPAPAGDPVRDGDGRLHLSLSPRERGS